MKNNQGYFSAITGIILGFIIISLFAFYVIGARRYLLNIPADTNSLSQYSNETFGLKQYTDHDFGFSFWYPGNWEVKEGTPPNAARFTKNKIVKYLRVGKEGMVYVFEVSSANGGITDYPGAAPFPPVNYYWDAAGKKWMVFWPEGNTAGQSAPATAAAIKRKTMSGLPMLESPSRFDTSIIPLGPDKFIVVSDGGGAVADYLARTVTPIGGSVYSPEQNAILKKEADAYAGQK